MIERIPELEKMLFIVAGLPAELQEEFFERIAGTLSRVEMRALYTGVAYFRMLKYPELKKAIKDALARELYEQFTGEVRKQ